MILPVSEGGNFSRVLLHTLGLVTHQPKALISQEHAHTYGSCILVLRHTSLHTPCPHPGKQAGLFLSDRGGG